MSKTDVIYVDGIKYYLSSPTWNIGEKHAVVYGFEPGKEVEELKIPASILNYEGEKLPVRAVNFGAFRGGNITKLDLSEAENLKVIEWNAFQKCPLTSLDFSGTPALTSISAEAFEGCGLKSVNFAGAEQLTNIREAAFANNELTVLDLSENKNLKHLDGFHHNHIEKIILNGLRKLEFINSASFAYNSELTEVDLRNCRKVSLLGSKSFYHTGLTSFDFSKLGGLHSIQENAFGETGIKKANLIKNSKLTHVHKKAFPDDCEITMPKHEVKTWQN